MVKLAYRNHRLKENPFDYCDNARFVRLGVNCYQKYRLLLRVLYWTGMRIGEIIALTYDDFEELANGRMRVSVTKSYNSAYKLLKGTKNDKTRKIPLPEAVIELYVPTLQEHLKNGGDGEGGSICVSEILCELAECRSLEKLWGINGT